jgi:hypothetical protein
MSALFGLGIVLATAGPASAQTYEEERRSIGLSPDPISRSPSLFGMGRLTVVGADPHNRITLWDFAANPAGIAEAESSSALDIRPGTSSASDVTELPPGPFERQTLAAREVRTEIEGWRRSGTSAYGAIFDFASLRKDEPYAANTELRRRISNPGGMAALNGLLPFVKSGRVKYALTLVTRRDAGEDQYRGFVRNAAGEYIDRNGPTYSSPNFFVPDRRRLTTIGGGAALSYRFGPWLEAAAIGDLVNQELSTSNSSGRFSSEIREQPRGHRPYPVGQATLIGRVGKNLEWGWDGRIWNARSEQRWAFTISAGIGQNPLAGRGKFADREERGSEMRSRVRWTLGPLEVGGSLGTGYLRNIILPPAQSDPTSLNRFLYDIYRRPNADSLALPDSVLYRRIEQRTWQAAGGIAVRLPGRRGLLGAEYHQSQDEHQQLPGGLGPRQVEWDVRTGLEYRCTQVLTGRAGYIHQSLDLDDQTRNNEFIGNTGTLGLGLQPPGAAWTLDVGYALELWRADYGDPALPHGSRQQLMSQIRWVF